MLPFFGEKMKILVFLISLGILTSKGERMLLSDASIKERIENGNIKIFPEFSMTDIRPAGIRLHLGAEILIPHKGQRVDFEKGDDLLFEKISLRNQDYILKPGQFILAGTYESFQVPRSIVCHLEGRSTVARVGLAIHCTSGIIDGNFDEARSIVLEIKNQGPFEIVLRYKTALAMLSFSQLTTDIEQNTQKQYRGQEGVSPPNLRQQKQ
jgi:dCTP deaminase